MFGGEDFAWLDALRRAHYPPERNVLPAHLTILYHLPPGVLPELGARLADACRAPPLLAEAVALMSLGGGTAIRVNCPPLERIRADLVEAFAGLLMPVDRCAWNPHITIQNKVPHEQARALREQLRSTFKARRMRIEGIGVWTVRGGLWEPAARHMFRG